MTGERTRRERLTEWLAARSVRQLVLAAGAVVLLVSGLFGGLREAEADADVPVTKLVSDRPHLAEPIRMTIKRVAWSEDLGEAIGPSEFGRYLVVIADVSTDQQDSVDSYVVPQSLRLTGLENLRKRQFDGRAVRSEDAEPRVLVTDDRVPLGEIGPGLTYEVAFIWEQKLSEPLPASVRLMARAHGFRQSSIDDQLAWFDVVDDAAGTFPVSQFGAA